ncbi:MAG: DUF937 domain-containing protein, partial [Polyangiaceae bacterium]|nr:DUF937 domain-containing protein [Polyangiaceae bacterium]
MTDSLIESIESRLSPDVVGKVAGSIGETPAKTSGVISSAVPSIMAGLMHRGSSTSGATGLLSSLKDVDHKSIGDMSDPRSTIASGSRLGAGMLGDTGGRITDMLAKQHGIRRESAAGIMGFLSPLVAGMLAKHVATKGLGPAGLSEFLMSQKKSILGHPGLPSGLANTLGIHNISALGGKNAEVSEPHVSIAQGRGVKQPHEEDDVTAVPPQHRGGTPWAPILGALALGAAVIGGFSYFARGRHIQTPVVRAPEIPRLEHPNVQPPPNNVEPPGAGRASLTSGEMEKKDGGQTSATSDEMEKKDGGQTSLTSGEMEKKDAGAEKTDK